MSKVCVFIDVAGQSIQVKKIFPEKKLDVTKYLKICKTFGDITRAFAYGIQFTKKSENFIELLKRAGYETKFKTIPKGSWFSWDVGLCMDVVKMISKCDVIVLGISHRDMVPLVLWAKEQGIKVIIVACNIDFDMKHACDSYIELDETLLKDEVHNGGFQGTREIDNSGTSKETHKQQSVVQRNGG